MTYHAPLTHGTKVNVSFVGTVKTSKSETNAATYGIPSYLLPSDDTRSGFVVVADRYGYDHLVWCRYDGHGDVFTVIESEPENWPPRAGDIWKTYFAEYVCRENRATAGRVVLERIDGSLEKATFGTAALEEFKAFKPVLIRRR